MKLRPFILDAGNAQIKVANPTGELIEDCFPHFFVRMTDGAYRTVVSRTGKADPEYILVNGVPYAMGVKAQRHGKFTRQHGAPRYCAEYYGVFLAYAMARTFGKSVDNVFLMGSHSPRDVAYAGDLLEAGCRTWEVSYMGKAMTFDVVDGSTFDEPLGGWANTTFRKDGLALANNKADKGHSIVIDIGAFTTDGLIIDPGGAVDYETARGETIGVLDAVEQFKRDLRNTSDENAEKLKKVKNLDELEVHKAFRTGIMNLRGLGTIECQELIDELSTSLVTDIVNFYDSYGGSANYDTLILTGGGSALFEDRLRASIDHKNILVADNAASRHMANVRGGLRWYNYHAQRGALRKVAQ